jgi:Protein of unknown function (DUF429)
MDTESTTRKSDPTSRRYLGIDFSGNFRMWSAGCGKTNVWIAEVESGASGLTLVELSTVQQLSCKQDHPFTRLVKRLRRADFEAAAIDAPFSIPAKYLRPMKHRELLDLVSRLEPREGRPFPSGGDFVKCVLKGGSPEAKKPLRRTEEYWKGKGVNVRSTMWPGARPGASMTVACLKLLWEARSPIWPWQKIGPGLLVEAFPAAQLRQWELPHQKYSRETDTEGAKNRRSIVSKLANRIDLRDFRGKLEQSADALDAVISAFAAVAVIGDHRLCYLENADEQEQEGLIAVDCERW